MFRMENSCLSLLDREDVYFIMKALDTVIAQWRNIGMCFGLYPKLDTIQADNSDVTNRMGAVVEHWLKRNYNTDKFGEPTWRKLVEVVGDPIGGNDANHARELAKQHPLKSNHSSAIVCVRYHTILIPHGFPSGLTLYSLSQ